MGNNFQLSKVFILVLSAFIFLFTGNLSAQFYAGGQSPGSIKWEQINSQYFQIIFPEGFETQANYLANVLEYARVLDGKTLANNPPKISVILHNRTVVSNAEVGWAPRRIEIFTQAPQDTYAQEWLQQLALHEYRHVVQIDKMNQGISRVLYALFGQQITAGIYGLFVPWWFIEGDAVVAETALSNSGRGRQPTFEMELRAQLLQKGMYSYDKAVHGSFKDFTPTHYHLGYYLVGQGRVRYGYDFWSKALDNVAKKPYLVTPFSSGIKNKTGLNKEEFYQSVLVDLDSIWRNQDKKINKTDFRSLTQSESFMNYLNPIPIGDNKVVAIKNNYNDVDRIVIIDDKGNEQNLLVPGRYFPETLSAKAGVICWLEYDYDPRWSYQTYTKLVTYSLEKKKKLEYTNKQRYFSPALNKDASKAVVVESSVNSRHNLAIIELKGGLKERIFRTKDNDFLSFPSWSDDQEKLIAISLKGQGKSIIEFDISTGEYQYLLPFSAADIQKPIYWKDYILYQGSYAGISNIYALHLPSKAIFQVTSSAFGAQSPAIRDGNLIYSEYTANGNQVALAELYPDHWKPISEIENEWYPLADLLQQQEDTVLKEELIPQQLYEIKKYSKIGHLIQPHSWGPFSFSMDNYGFKPGLSLSTQNKLSTFTMSMGYEYDINYQEGTYFADASYLGWYPALSMRAGYGYRERNVHDSHHDSTYLLAFNETSIRSSLYVPLYFTSGDWYQRIQPQINYEYLQRDVVNSTTRLRQSNFQVIDYSFSISNDQRSAKQNVYPKWGQHLSFLYRQTPFDSSGDLIALNSMFYFPGILKHQGIRFYLGYQKREGEADFYNNKISVARGYFNLSLDRAYSLKLDYKMPIAYPDFNIGPLLYVKRITLAVFYDETKDMDGEVNSYRSIGNDITLDIHMLRSFVPMEIGLRSAYLLDDKKMYFGFLGSIKL